MEELKNIWHSLGEWQDVIILAIPIVAWLLRFPIGRLMLRGLNSFLKAIGLKLSEDLQDNMQPALRIFVVTVGVLIANEHFSPPEPYFSIIEKLMVSASVAAAFSVAYAMCIIIPELLERSRRLAMGNQSMLVLRASRFLVTFLGIAAILKVWGVDIGPALTGMGVAGAAFAFAAQDTVKNFLGGLNNVAERRFREGDFIRVDGVVEGTVEAVDMRSTRIRRLDTAPVHVPNSDLANCAVINFGRMPNRRINWNVGLKYDTPNKVLVAIRDRVEDYIDNNGSFAPAESTGRYVRITALGTSSIDLLICCYTRTGDYANFLEVQEALALAVLGIIEEEGGDIAFPSRTIYMNTPGGVQEPVEMP